MKKKHKIKTWIDGFWAKKQGKSDNKKKRGNTKQVKTSSGK
jgi:hypothetical protein